MTKISSGGTNYDGNVIKKSSNVAKINKGGVYIHIPYCLSKCNYCDFVSYAGKLDTMDAYVNALIKEIELYAKKQKFLVESVYFGGGTPSLLFFGAVTRILEALRQGFEFLQGAEITIEANPKTLTEDKVAEYMSTGVNRFSLGLQSTENRVLKAAGRVHTYRDFLNTVVLLRKHGANNISADMMMGLPEQTVKDAVKTAESLVGLHLEHISAYGLILEKGTPLYKDVAAKRVSLPDEDTAADMYDAVANILERAGFNRYEISNFARAEYKCKHNINYWRRGEYLGFGAAAHGFLGGKRYRNEKSVEKYIAKIERGLSGKVFEEKILLEDAEKEFIMLALRTEEGLDTERFEELFLVDFFVKYEVMLKRLYNSGAVYFEGIHLKVSADRFRVLNGIILEFF